MDIRLHAVDWRDNALLIGVAVAAAFAGSFLGSRILPRATYGLIRVSVVSLLAVISLGLATGLL